MEKHSCNPIGIVGFTRHGRTFTKAEESVLFEQEEKIQRVAPRCFWAPSFSGRALRPPRFLRWWLHFQLHHVLQVRRSGV